MRIAEELTWNHETEEYDQFADDSVCTVDWKEHASSVLEAIDFQLEPFGLEIVQYETGCDEYMWRIDKRMVVDADQKDGGKPDSGGSPVPR